MFFFLLFLTAKTSGAWLHLGTSTASVRFDEFRGPRPVAWDQIKLMLTGNDTLISNAQNLYKNIRWQYSVQLTGQITPL